MISVEEARAYILKHFHPLETERVELLEALDRVLAEDIVSDINVPPHDNSAMDGYAVCAEDIAGASLQNPIRLRVLADLGAGYVPNTTVEPGSAIRIMTGAVIPPGADTVVRFEETSEAVAQKATGKGSGYVEILNAPPRGSNLRRAGEDIRRGEIILPKGVTLRPPEIGLLASVGCAHVPVHRRPRVAILATGDELVDVDEPLAPGKIRNSNEYSNAAAVLKAGGIPICLGIARDNIAHLTQKIREGIDAGADLFITSAGVSVGDYDIVKDVLNTEGEMHFWQVNMKPGKPLAFGIVGNVPLLGLPGNPVSAIVSFEAFARPAILTMLGKTNFARPYVTAILQERATNDAGRRNYIRVHVARDAEGEYVARTTGEQGSGILSSVTRANGLLEMPPEVLEYKPGERVKITMLDYPEESF
ncbi:MAG: molybdopterin molybdotransferase MoeA [Chloroflexi bacterium]|nr:molybdopterin molybdotransferase MoeA [Chloroflexota bacterium]